MTEPAIGRPRHARRRCVAPPAPRRARTSGRPASPPDDPTWWRSAVIYEVYVAELRRRQRRRHRRPRRRPRAAGLSARPGGRRHLVHALVRLAARRWRLRRGRLPGHRSRASARSPRPRRSSRRPSSSASGPSSTSSPTTSPTSTPGSRRRSPRVPAPRNVTRFWFRPGRGADGARSADRLAQQLLGQPTWTRTTNPDGTPGEWYLHLFTAEQPDLNWDHPDVRARARGHPPVLVRPRRRRRAHRLRGAAGQGPDACPRSRTTRRPGDHPIHDRDELHDIYRSWRAIADGYPGHARAGRRGLAARTSSGSPCYLRPDELHTAFNFDFMAQPWDAAACARRSTRRSPRTRRSARRRPGSCPTTTSPGP